MNWANVRVTSGKGWAIKLVESLTLKHGEIEYKLKFNCKPCEMEMWKKDAEFEMEE